MKQVALIFILLISTGFTLALSVSEKGFKRQLKTYEKNQEVFCWKRSYGRGVGKVPTVCPEGKQLNGGLCYKFCRPKYKGIGPVCWKFPKSYGRGVGKVPKKCKNQMVYNVGLCYKPCNPKYKGIGPVCWKRCLDRTPYDCGAACASSRGTCIKNIFKMVFAVFNMILKLKAAIVSKILSLKDALSKCATPTETFKRVYKIAKEFRKKKYHEETFVKFFDVEGNKAKLDYDPRALKYIFNHTKAGQDKTGQEWAKLSLKVVSQFDPVGISGIIEAFMHELC